MGHRKLSSKGNPKERRSITTMAQQHHKSLFKKARLQLITEPDPFLVISDNHFSRPRCLKQECYRGLLARLFPQAQSAGHEKDRTLHLRRSPRDPGRGAEGMAGVPPGSVARSTSCGISWPRSRTRRRPASRPI
jgi:hypothetical protein